MGLFKKSLSDVEKYRASQDIEKLTDALKEKEPEISLAALRALLELKKAEVLEGMIRHVAASPHIQVRREFKTFISGESEIYSKPLADELVAELKRLVVSGKLLRMDKQWVQGVRPGSLPVLLEWLSDLRPSSVPEVRRLLDHEVPLVKIVAAETLEQWDDEGSRLQRLDVLERRDVGNMDLHFERSQEMNKAVRFGEIPLAYTLMRTLTTKVGQASSYSFGLTDEALYILAEYGDLRWKELGKWRIPLSQIQSMTLTFEDVLVIELSTPVIDSEDLHGPTTSRLSFKTSQKEHLEKTFKVVELFGNLKKGGMKKAEIVESYFDRENVSLW